jgi:hypothetical protein
MLLRNPLPDPDLRRKFNEFDTETEHPAMPKESRYSGMPDTHPHWHDSLPQIPKPNYPPDWDRPSKKQLDIEKLVGRGFIIVMALVTITFASIYLVKLVQFSIAVTLK